MKNIWSENKYVNITIDVLLFLLGMNFMHYAQIIIPIICIILFVDNRFNFKVNNVKTFVILCLFGISFLFFVRKQGLFAFIGLFIPMAYYVGSNLKEVNEENIKSIIYIIAFGMMTHALLNFGLDLSEKGFHIFFSTSHHDIWTLMDISETTTSINYVFLYGIIYYVIFHEKNKFIKALAIMVFVISSFYCIALGERTIFLLLIISLTTSFILDIFVFKTSKINKKILIAIVLLFSLWIIVFLLLYLINNTNHYNSLLEIRFLSKFIEKGLNTERFDILLQTIKIAPQHLWGNNEISLLIGIMPHDLWSDVYDLAGIITFILLLIHTTCFIVVFIKTIKNNKISNDFKLLICPLLLCAFIQMLLEPIMTGLSLFLIIIVIVEALIEKLNIYAK